MTLSNVELIVTADDEIQVHNMEGTIVRLDDPLTLKAMWVGKVTSVNEEGEGSFRLAMKPILHAEV